MTAPLHEGLLLNLALRSSLDARERSRISSELTTSSSTELCLMHTAVLGGTLTLLAVHGILLLLWVGLSIRKEWWLVVLQAADTVLDHSLLLRGRHVGARDRVGYRVRLGA